MVTIPVVVCIWLRKRGKYPDDGMYGIAHAFINELDDESCVRRGGSRVNFYDYIN